MSHTVLIKPVLTEKSLKNKSVYTFEVNKQSTKTEVKEMIEKNYKVEVKSVRVSVAKGKWKMVGRKRVRKQEPTIKKAYVTLSKGKIEDIALNS